ncbi:M14 family metallopeptidase [Novosphingobium album (ex Liu et al. 2023)]|uniref:M14 family metallopeptidase n=1 Tax=Novosphingobium album (ex Liu et al. 2023) TaxID=3031130 RepID=A0ABT5WND1_9SPHN|nr:M14 family metallopeptidase [Novosphingobium album (ex Liu et al. 2023)]MDE8651542.1 M14 family metallopeptidase [Novosphingobium album (ex Liu et al. 2023)]
MAVVGTLAVPELTIRDSLPDGFLDCAPRDLHRLLPEPTLIELPGRRAAPLFVSILLHGNETSSLAAIQQLLRARAGHALPRALMLLVGNVSAAREGLRRLDGQPDYNRIWPGTVAHAGTPEAAVMAQVHARVLARQPFAAIDLHNNTGLNPYYAVVCGPDPRTLHLAALFSRIAVWFRGIPGTQTASFAGAIPAITAECGQPGVAANATAAARLVDAALSLAAFPDHPLRHEDIDLYHTMAVVRVRPDVAIGAAADAAGLRFDAGLDRMNFREMPAGARFGETGHAMPVEVVDEAGRDVAGKFFSTRGGVLRLRRDAMPAMLTCDERVIRQDCLCYLMERVGGHDMPPGAIA